jgi:O-methyltransferase involved in polyketide biosynthesis
MRVAMRRAAHQLFDQPKVLDDPVALPIIGPEAAARLEGERNKHKSRVARNLRAFLVARSRFAEDELARAIVRGVRQYVILGAGLDTFAY